MSSKIPPHAAPSKQGQNTCGKCDKFAIHDLGLDFNVCRKCGAHETAVGWVGPPAGKEGSPPTK